MVKVTKYDGLNFTSASKDLFFSKKWIDTIVKTYGFDYYIAFDPATGAQIVFTLLNDLKGERLVSLPFCDYTDTLHINTEDYKKLIAELRLCFPDIPFILKTNYSSIDLIGENIREAFYHIVETTSYDVIKSNYSSAFNRGIRKAENAGVEVTMDYSIDGIRQFYKLYTSLRINKFNSIPQPFSFFERLFDMFIRNDRGFVLNAVYKKVTIASIVVLLHKNTVYYKFGASDLNNLEFRPNNVLFDSLFKYAVNTGFNKVNLGLTGASEGYKGLLRFKEAMGGKAQPINYYRINPEGYERKAEENASLFLKNLTGLIVNNKNIDIKEISEFSELIYPNFA